MAFKGEGYTASFTPDGLTPETSEFYARTVLASTVSEEKRNTQGRGSQANMQARSVESMNMNMNTQSIDIVLLEC